MVLEVISNQGHVMPPYFFEKGLNVNSDVYINVLRTVVKPWMDNVAGGVAYTFQQDAAQAHMAKKTQDCCHVNFPNFWPWSAVEADANAKPHSTLDSLKLAIRHAIAQSDVETLKRACVRFRTRLEQLWRPRGTILSKTCS
uniref:Uncharacterized protein n=1 Tax=Lepeophtheirus salmonis TaxID=72036 RepID=A0A0K2TPX1_LEPSM